MRRARESFERRNILRNHGRGEIPCRFAAIAALATVDCSQEKKESTEAHKMVRFGDLK
jgi:hypothetical protein